MSKLQEYDRGTQHLSTLLMDAKDSAKCIADDGYIWTSGNIKGQHPRGFKLSGKVVIECIAKSLNEEIESIEINIRKRKEKIKAIEVLIGD